MRHQALIRLLASVPLLFCCFVTSASAQLPLIYSRSTFNAASYMPAGVPAGAIAQGSIFSVFGANIGPSTPAGPGGFPLQTNLAGVTINVIQGATTVQAIPVFVSASQINAIMPSNAPVGTASLQVVFKNARSNMSPVRIASSAMGIFTALGTGLGPGAIENFVTASNQPLNTPAISAKLGQPVTLYGTGLGPVTGGDNVQPPTGSLPIKVEVFVGGISAPVAYSGRSPCCAGLDQVTFTVPPDAPAGLLGSGVCSHGRNGDQQLRQHGDLDFWRRLHQSQIVLHRQHVSQWRQIRTGHRRAHNHRGRCRRHHACYGHVGLSSLVCFYDSSRHVPFQSSRHSATAGRVHRLQRNRRRHQRPSAARLVAAATRRSILALRFCLRAPTG